MEILKYRLTIFLSVAFFLVILEFFYFYRIRVLDRKTRWTTNLLIILFDSIFLKILLPVGLFGVANWTAQHNLGIFNYFKINSTSAAILTFIIFDLAIYYQHVFSHKWSLLWKFHQVHHTDPDLDVTTALRFHPGEMLYSLIFKVCLIICIGANPLSILVFEVVLNAMSMFNHANIHLPERFEKILRYIIVTPQMHIIHHSVLKKESDTNFGFNFSIWDYLFNSYTPKFLSDGKIGQKDFFDKDKQHFLYLLRQPFMSKNKLKNLK